MQSTTIAAQPFTIAVPQEMLDDLQTRLRRTRWPDEAGDFGWSRGVSLAYMKDLAAYWQSAYDWRRHEARLNAFHQFTAEIDGVEIHFIHERSTAKNAIPLILSHGWPDSFYRYHKVIPLLTEAFDVVVPSIPGFGFSARKAFSEATVADLWLKLMRDVLGYERFAAAGGDRGGIITQYLAFKYPEAVSAIHLTDVGYPGIATDLASLTPEERAFAGYIQRWWFQEGAFNMVQSTKPLSLAYGLADSPAGLAAWIMNFFCIDTTGEEVERRISRDELLTNLMIYWVTGTITSSVDSYYVSARAASPIKPGERVEVPSAVAHCELDAPLPRRWAERNVNLRRYISLPNCGHFAAWEAPEMYGRDLREFFEEFGRS